jgi:flagellar motility protein MotE (MotC chaperone)
VSKKLIMIIAPAGFVSFAGAFIFAWLTKPAPISQSASGEPNQPHQQAEQQEELKLPQPEFDAIALREVGDNTIKQPTIQPGMTEKQLRNLIYEVQEKKKQYENTLHSLQAREDRIQMAQVTLKKDIENLNNLRIELATMVAHLKEQRDKLLASRVEIAQAEKANLAKIAAFYDKMDATSASRILVNMCTEASPNTKPADGQSNMNDAVKILHYMNERTKAKLLAELVTSEPELAAVLCRKLKQITETN